MIATMNIMFFLSLRPASVAGVVAPAPPLTGLVVPAPGAVGLLVVAPPPATLLLGFMDVFGGIADPAPALVPPLLGNVETDLLVGTVDAA